MEKKKEQINPEKNKFSGRKFWYSEQEQKLKPREMAEKAESEERLKRLEIAIKTIKNELKDEEIIKIKAIIVYGSTGREKPSKTGDIDIHIDLEPYDQGVFEKIINILEGQFSDIDLSFTSKNIIEGGRMAKLITNQKFLNEPAAWKFIYKRSEQDESELNRILSETQKNQHFK